MMTLYRALLFLQISLFLQSHEDIGQAQSEDAATGWIGVKGEARLLLYEPILEVRSIAWMASTGVQA